MMNISPMVNSVKCTFSGSKLQIMQPDFPLQYQMIKININLYLNGILQKK